MSVFPRVCTMSMGSGEPFFFYRVNDMCVWKSSSVLFLSVCVVLCCAFWLYSRVQAFYHCLLARSPQSPLMYYSITDFLLLPGTLAPVMLTPITQTRFLFITITPPLLNISCNTSPRSRRERLDPPNYSQSLRFLATPGDFDVEIVVCYYASIYTFY